MIYLFLAEGFEEIEALATADILRRAGGQVKLAGVGGLRVKGAHGVVVEAELLAEEVPAPGPEDAVVLPGGPGTSNLEASAAVQAAVDSAARSGAWLAAICAAPSILGHKGLLRGKKAVCYKGYEKDLEGAQVQDTPVCEDGRVLTGNGPGAALQFGLLLAQRICGADARRLKDAMRIA